MLTLAVAGQDALDPQVGVDADGDAVVIWRRLDGANGGRLLPAELIEPLSAREGEVSVDPAEVARISAAYAEALRRDPLPRNR